MKCIYAFLLAAVFALSAMAQTDAAFARRVESWYKPIKGDSVWASQCECSNSQYNEFITYLKEKNDRQNYILNRPDSSGWNFARIFPHNKSNNDAIAKMYHVVPAFADYPVVNVNFQAAVAYCNWLTRQYNSSKGRRFKRVVFRLPDAEEWKYAARGIATKAEIYGSSPGRRFPWPGAQLKDKKGKYFANFAPLHDAAVKRNENYHLVLTDSTHFTMMGADGFVYTAPCNKSTKKYYKPNEYGLYHLAGNVSEFILEEGKAKGGSYISPGYYLLIDTDEAEFRQEMLGGPFIGFRPFMFVIER